MVLSFQKRFEKKIRSKEKRHTIRAKRKGRRQFRVGDRLDCYVGLRQKGAYLLGRWPCVKIQGIQIKGRFHRYGGFIGGVLIDGEQLMQDECEALARSDGFSNFDEMTRFWKGRMPFCGFMIHWDPERPQPAPQKRKRGTGTNGQKDSGYGSFPDEDTDLKR
jgi:hypothetical protein